MGKAELESSLSALDVWLIVFGVFVAIGVVGESVAGFLHWRRSGQLQMLQTAENLAQQREIERLSGAAETARGQIAEATKAAATANERAAGANERAANLEKEAAAANARAAEIMKATAWRQFTPDQMQRLSSFLLQKSGKIVIAWIANDSKSLSLAIQFANIFDGKDNWSILSSAKNIFWPTTLANTYSRC